MSLKTNKELLDRAKAEGYAVGAFNVNNIEQTIAALEAAEEEKSPIIIAVTEGAIKYAGEPFFFDAVPKMLKAAGVPASLHLDHGKKMEMIMKCVGKGFTSVMYDGSSLSFEANVAETRKVAEAAKARRVSVEGEIGRVGGVESGVSSAPGGDEELLTDPEEAKRFVELTGIDSVAVAVGTVHGMRKQTAKIDLDRISAIAALVTVPLVLHGASGAPDETCVEVVKRGIHKINIGTELQKSFARGVADFIASNPDVIDPRKILRPGMNTMKEAVRNKIRLFGSAGRAW
ncbi:MAG TPA: class II fructose-bisphosphate aldolase [bacterium]|nr:class II fructose-bisphosphate aldolase [bacterium]